MKGQAHPIAASPTGPVMERSMLKKLTQEEVKEATVTISPPKFERVRFELVGTSPLCINRFDQKTQELMRETQAAGSVTQSKKKRAPKDFEGAFKRASYRHKSGWYGIHAGAFRNAMIAVCRLVNFKMTHAKLSIFVEADGFDVTDGTPLVRIIGGEPEVNEMAVRNANGSVDLRWRPLWREWGASLVVKYDTDQFTRSDVANLLMRAGQQCGIGEGRPSSKSSNGIGWGQFEIKGAGKPCK